MAPETYIVKSIDRTKFAGKAIGEYADAEYRKGLFTGIIIGLAFSSSIFALYNYYR